LPSENPEPGALAAELARVSIVESLPWEVLMPSRPACLGSSAVIRFFVRPLTLVFALSAGTALFLSSGCSDEVIMPRVGDTVPPPAVTDLAVTAVDGGSATLVWTAPGDRGFGGRPEFYDIRYSTSEISSSSWSTASRCVCRPDPGRRGDRESFVVAGLLNDTEYYFALKSVDRFFNWSELSNVPSATTGSRLIWSYDTEGWVRSSPAVGSDGIVYVKDDYRIVALKPEGTVYWFDSVGGDVYASPAVGGGDTVFVSTGSERLCSFRLQGLKSWCYQAGGAIRSSPAIGGDGTIYVGSADARLHAIRPNGTSDWYFTTGEWVQSSPALGSDGTIYVGSGDGALYAVSAAGIPEWSFETAGWISSSPAIGPDGTIYVGSHDGRLYAVGPDGDPVWHYQTGSPVKSSPAIGADGTVYIGSDNGRLYAIGPDGRLDWFYQTGYRISSSPAVAADGTIYVGSEDGSLYAIGAEGIVKWSHHTGGAVISSPVIGTDGTVYVGSDSGFLFALRGDSPPAASSWPMFRHDARHTGRVYYQ